MKTGNNSSMGIPEKTKSQLLAIVKSAFGDNSTSITIEAEDIDILEACAIKQSIFYIYFYGMKKLGYSNLLSSVAKQYEPKSIYDCVQRTESLRRISKALKEEGVSFIPLKGAVLRELYPLPYMRTSSDVDVLVHENDLQKAIQILEAKTDFKYKYHAHHDVHLINSRIHLELHFSLKTNIDKIDHILESAWEYSEEADNGEWRFSPEFQVFYITAHAAKHFVKEGGTGIRPLLDLWILINRTKYDAGVVEELCDRAGILGYFKMCNNLLDVWFNNLAYTDDTKAFEDLVMEGGVFGSERTKVLIRKRQNNGVKYIVKRVFWSSKDIKEMYPKSDRHPSLVPIYQVARWTHVFRPSKQKAIRTELRQSRELDSKDVEVYDHLLKIMGL